MNFFKSRLSSCTFLYVSRLKKKKIDNAFNSILNIFNRSYVFYLIAWVPIKALKQYYIITANRLPNEPSSAH